MCLIWQTHIYKEHYTYHANQIEMCVYTSVCVFVCLFVCMLLLGERLDGLAQFFLEVVGKVQGSVLYVPNNYFDVTHVKHKEISFEEKC